MTKTLRYITLGVLFIIPFLSLYVAGSMYFPFITGKNFAFRILVEIAVAGWVLLMLADRKYRPQFSWTLVLFGALTAWMAIADFLAVNPHKAFWSNFERMDGWVMLIHVFLFFLVAGSVLTAEKLWRPWWLTFLGAQFLVCCYGLMQIFGMTAIHQSSTRIDASLGNAEYLAGYLLFGIAASLWLAFDTKEKRERHLRYGLFAFTALQVAILLATGTRGTFVGLVAAAAFGAFAWLLTAGKSGRKGAAVALIAIAAVVGSLYVFRTADFIQDHPIYSRFASISLDELKPRFAIWGTAYDGIMARPVTGWGHEGFNYVFNTYFDPVLYGQESWFDRAHNIYLDWLIAGGIPALLLFLALLGYVAFSFLRAPVSRAERIVILSVLVAYAVQGLVVFDNLFTFIPLAAFYALAHAYRMRPIAKLEALPEARTQQLTSIGLPAAIVVLVAVVAVVNVPGMAMAKSLIYAVSPGDITARHEYFKRALATRGFAEQEVREQFVQFAANVAVNASVPTAQKVEIVNMAIAEMHRELERAPKDARLHIQLAMLFRALGDYPNAMKESALARELSPQKQTIIIEQGVEVLQAGDAVQAEKYFMEAFALASTSPDLASYVAAARILGGDTASGKAFLMEHVGTTTLDHSILVFAYYQIKDWQSLIPILSQRTASSDDVNTWLQLVAVQMQAGRPADAQQTVRELLKIHPEAANQAAAVLSQPLR